MNFDGMKKRQKTGRIRIEIVNVFSTSMLMWNFAFFSKPLAPGFVYICVNQKMFAPPKKSMAETFLIGATWLKYIAEQK